MTVEFTHGRTYQCTIAVPVPRPATIQIPFRPCILKPAFVLELEWLGTDDVRGIELYKPIREIHS